MISSNSSSRQILALGVVWIAALAIWAPDANGQVQGFPDDFFNGFNGRNGGNPFDPNQMMKSMFGPPTEEEARALAEIEISIRDEQRFGNNLVNNYLKAKKSEGVEFTERGPRVEYMETLVEKVREQMPNSRRYRRMRVIVSDAHEPDAMSFPGGTLVFNEGLIEFCENEAALLGVVGHELSHLDRGHQLLPLRRSKLAEKTFSGQGGFDPRKMMQNFSVLSETWMRPFRPEDETVADEDGATWVYQTGYDPRELAKLFLRIKETRKRGDSEVPAFLRTHPFDEDRYRSIVNRYEELRRADPDRELKLGTEEHQEMLRSFR